MLKNYSHFIGEKTEAKRGDLPSHTAKCGFNPLPFELQSLTTPHPTHTLYSVAMVACSPMQYCELGSQEIHI